jgi:N-dimethylarginine dimethylaminohydrolase
MALDREIAPAKKLSPPFNRTDGAALLHAVISAPSAALAACTPLKGEPNAILERALDQHLVLGRRLAELGVAVRILAPGPTAGSCAAGDLAVVVRAGAVLMRPSDLERGPEVAAIESVLREHGIPVLGRIEPPGLLDGGDILVTEGAVFVGIPVGSGRHERRGNRLGREQFAEILGVRLVEVPMDADVARLRSVAAVIDANTVLVGGAAAAASAFVGFEVIALPLGEEYAAGVITLGPRSVLSNLRFQETPVILRNAKIRVEALDLWEIGKLGLSPSTLLLALQRR